MASTSDTLKNLLLDMGQFLGDTLVGETLSSAAEKQRAGLLQRLNPHIQGQSGAEISAAPITPPPYLDMNGSKGVREEYVNAEVNNDVVEEEYEEFPELAPPPVPVKIPIDNQPNSKTDSSNSGQSEDYVNLSLPYSELRTMTKKCGRLWRKEKFIFLDQWRQYWAGVYGHVVLIYNSERDTKPSSSVDVKGFEARPLTVNNLKDPKKKNAFFEIVCPGKKTHQFVAQTAKDMIQWVTAICLASTQATPTVPHRLFLENSRGGRRQLPSLPDSDVEMYDDIGSPKYENDEQNYEPLQSEEEEIYHDIADIYQGGSVQPKLQSEVKTVDEQPPVPPRRPVPSIPRESLSDNESLYDDVGVSNLNNTYCNTVDVSDGVIKQEELPQESSKHEGDAETKEEEKEAEEEEEEEEEDIYDDVGIIEKAPEKTFPVFRRESSGGNGRIQNLIKKMEASFSNGNKMLISPHQAKSKVIKQRSESEELYEPIESDGVEIASALPQLPPRSNVVH